MRGSSRAEVERELRRLVETEGFEEIRREGRDFAAEVRNYARRKALEDMNRGYATGEFVESIKMRAKTIRGRLPSWLVFSQSPIAHLLEDGTVDTPAYHTFAKTDFHFHGDGDGTPDE